MTSNRLITLLRELTENQYTDSVLMMWLSNCENTVLTDVMLASPEDCVELTEPSDEKLLVPHPWDKLYLPYMQAQVAHANGEYDHYANYIALFNAYLEEYARHILETVRPAGGEAVTHGYYLSAYAIAVEHGYKGTVEQWLKSLIGPQGDGGKDAYTIAVEHGYTGTVEQWLESLIGPQGDKGDKGETTLPIARGTTGDSIAYIATGDDLPTVKAGSSGSHIGKGRQIVFIPDRTNTSIAPTLKLNGSEIIPLRLRAPRNQGSNDQAPDATLPVPVGALISGVPYTLTFCGKYWLIDSMISQFDEYNERMLNKYASALIGLDEGDTVAVPIINSMDEGVDDGISTMYIRRSTSENNTPDQSGDVTVPTEKRVEEMLRKDITADYTAWTPESGTAKTVENYTKTLPDGRYRIWNDNTDYWFIDTFTIVNSQKWRIIRQYTDEFFYLTAYYGESIMLDMDVEVGTLALGGRTLLTNDNIPLPTAADAGKVLTASAAGRAAWTAVKNAEEVAV